MKQKALAQLLFLFFATALSIFALVMMFSSCDTAKRAQRHHIKSIKFGTVYSCDPDTIQTTFTIKGKDGKDSLIYVDVPCNCPDVELPKSRFEIRFDNKRFDDSLDFIKAKYRDSLKYALKSNKTDSKTQIKLSQDQTTQVKQHTKGIVKTAFPWEWLFVLCISIVILIFLKWKR